MSNVETQHFASLHVCLGLPTYTLIYFFVGLMFVRSLREYQKINYPFCRVRSSLLVKHRQAPVVVSYSRRNAPYTHDFFNWKSLSRPWTRTIALKYDGSFNKSAQFPLGVFDEK